MTDKVKEVLDKVREKTNGNTILVAKVVRIKGDTFLYLESDEAIENLFEGEVQESDTWDNGDSSHNYYQDNYSGEVSDFFSRKYDKFGYKVFDLSKEKVNAGLLRTVGISDGVLIRVRESYSPETLKEAICQLKDMAKELNEKFIEPCVLVSEVKELEIDGLTNEPEGDA